MRKEKGVEVKKKKVKTIRSCTEEVELKELVTSYQRCIGKPNKN